MAEQSIMLKLQEDGIPHDRALAITGDMHRSLVERGFTSDEANAKLGIQTFETSGVQDWLVSQARSAFGEYGADFVGDLFTMDDFLSAGFGQSVTSLVFGPPSKEQQRVASMPKSVIQQGIMSLGTIYGDIPSMALGFVVGGGVGLPTGPGALITGTAGAFAMPEALRTILMDQYENGTPASFSEAWDLFLKTAEAGAKAYITGGATAGTGLLLRPLTSAILPGTFIPKTVNLAGEVATFTTVGAGLEGRLPEPEEFLEGAIAITGLKISTKGAGYTAKKLRNAYRQYGARPLNVAEDAKNEPSIVEDLVSSNQDTPRAYGGGPNMTRRDFLAGSAAAMTVLATSGKVSLDRMTVPRNTAKDTEVVIVEGDRGLADVFPRYMADVVPELSITKLEGVKNFGEFQELMDRFLDEMQQYGAYEVPLVSIFRKEGVLRVENTEKLTPDELNALVKKLVSEGYEHVESDFVMAHDGFKSFAKRMQETENKEHAEETIHRLTGDRFTVDIETGELVALDAPGVSGMAENLARGAAEAERLAIEDNTVRQELAVEHNRQTAPSAGDIVGDRISVGESKDGKPWSFGRIYAALLDDLHPLAQVVKAITNGKVLPAHLDPYKLARNLKGVAGVGDAFLEFGVLDYASKRIIGPSLRSILRPIDLAGNLNDFRRYAVSKRVVELSLDEKETGVPLEAAKATVLEFEAKFSDSFNQLREYQDALLQYVRDSGIIGEHQYAAMKEANYDYVPFYRVMDKGASTGFGLRSLTLIKRFRGSERKIIDPIESILRNSYVLTALAERQRVVHAMVELGVARPDLIRKKKGVPHQVKIAGEELAKLLEPYVKKGAAKELSEKEIAIFRNRTVLSNGDLVYFRDGKAEIYEVSPALTEAFGAMDRAQLDITVRILSLPASMLRTGAILTPEFMSRNILRDTLSAFVYSKDGFIPLVDTFIGMGHILGRSKAWKDWVISGGMFAHLQSIDRSYHQKGMKELLTSIPMRNILKNPIEHLRAASALAEQGTRVAVHARRSRKAQKKEGKPRIEAITEAGFESRDVTLDFQRFGSKTRSLNHMSAFFNAWLQGHDKLIREFKNHPVAMSAKVMAGITLPSIILHLINRDEKWYKELPQWQRDIYWHMDIDGQIWKFPKPFELGVIFGTGAERAVDFVLGDNPRAAEEMLATVSGLALPNVLPTAIAVPMEIWSNKSVFFGTPIVPRDREGMLPEYQYGIYTSETAKQIGSLIGRIPALSEHQASSPAVIEHLVRGWTGGLGKHTLDLIDRALLAAGVKPDAVKPTPAHLTDIPLVKAFIVRHPSMNTSTIERFYEEYGTRSVRITTFKKLMKEGRISEAVKVFRNSVEQYQLTQLDGQKKAIDTMIRSIRKIHRMPSIENMSDEDLANWKREQIDTIYINIHRLAKVGLSIVDASKPN
jgi:hypothetical protein